MNHHNHRESSIEYRASSIDNPTLAHFRHFSSLFTNLTAYKAAVIYVPIRHTSTLVENPLQIDLFMQNKPNFQNAQMNANIYKTKAYDNKSNWTLGQNKPNSNPIKPNFKKAKMNVNSFITKDYIKKCRFRSPKKQTQFLQRPKMNVSNIITMNYKNLSRLWGKKTKPKQTQLKSCPERSRISVFCLLSSVFCPLSAVFCPWQRK